VKTNNKAKVIKLNKSVK